MGGLREGEVELGSAPAHYVSRVLRLGPGASLMLVDAERGLEAVATISAVGPGRVCCKVETPTLSASEGLIEVHLLYALAKGDKNQRVLRAACELGVASVTLFEAKRSVRRQRGRGQVTRWQRVVDDAVRQSGRSRTLRLLGPVPLADAVVTVDGGAKLVGEPSAQSTVYEVLQGIEPGVQSFHLVVGPEGGLCSQELELLGVAGFEAVRLGPTTLRTETAAIALLGALRAWTAR